MKKILAASLTILILPAILVAGFNFGLIKAAKKTADKVDEQVATKKAEIASSTPPPVSNNTPVISLLTASPISISTGAVSAITCTASDADGDSLTYSWSAASGTISGISSMINWTAPASSSTYAVNVTVSDGHGGSAQSSVNVVVTKSNNPPTISSLTANPTTISTGAVSAITCSASDADGDPLTYSWSTASGTISGTGSTINWTAPASSSTYTINVTVSDGHGGSAQSNVNVVTTRGNISPVITAVVPNPATLSTGAVSAITCSASDADADTLTYSWSAASGTISGTGSTINWTAPASSSTYTINVTVSDGHGGSAQSSASIAVTKSNNSPSISSLIANPTSILTGAATTITCTASDADSDPLTYSWSAANGSISGNGQTATWTAPGTAGTYTVTVTVTDGQGGSVQSSVNVSVTAPPVHALPDTGQSLSYTATFGEDNDYQPAVAQPNYTDNGNGTVTDNKTGLMWPKDGIGQGCSQGTWEQALAFCEGLNYAGYTDWRLPNRRELSSIVNYGRFTPAINTTYFTNTSGTFFWTSTTYATDTIYAWGVSFDYGVESSITKAFSFYIRCVRAGP